MARRSGVLLGIYMAAFGVFGLAQPTQSTVDPSVGDLLRITNIAPRNVASRGAMLPVDVDVLNSSSKTITAYKIVLTGHYADGNKTESDYAADAVGAVISADLGEDLDRARPFSPGTTQRGTAFVHADPDGLPPTLATGRVMMIIFADRTAVGDETAVKDALARRMGESRDLADLVEQARSLPTDQEVLDALASPDVLSRIQKAMADHIARSPRRPTSTSQERSRQEQLKPFALALRRSRSDFDALVGRLAARQQKMVEYSTLKGDQ